MTFKALKSQLRNACAPPLDLQVAERVMREARACKHERRITKTQHAVLRKMFAEAVDGMSAGQRRA